MIENFSLRNVWKKFRPGIFEKVSARNVREIFGPSSKIFRTELLEGGLEGVIIHGGSLSTRKYGIQKSIQCVRKMFDPRSSKNVRPKFKRFWKRNGRKIFDPECSKNFRPEMIKKMRTRFYKKFPTRNVWKNSDPKYSKKIDPECSKEFRLEMFENFSA